MATQVTITIPRNPAYADLTEVEYGDGIGADRFFSTPVVTNPDNHAGTLTHNLNDPSLSPSPGTYTVWAKFVYDVPVDGITEVVQTRSYSVAYKPIRKSANIMQSSVPNQCYCGIDWSVIAYEYKKRLYLLRYGSSIKQRVPPGTVTITVGVTTVYSGTADSKNEGKYAYVYPGEHTLNIQYTPSSDDLYETPSMDTTSISLCAKYALNYIVAGLPSTVSQLNTTADMFPYRYPDPSAESLFAAIAETIPDDNLGAEYNGLLIPGSYSFTSPSLGKEVAPGDILYSSGVPIRSAQQLDSYNMIELRASFIADEPSYYIPYTKVSEGKYAHNESSKLSITIPIAMSMDTVLFSWTSPELPSLPEEGVTSNWISQCITALKQCAVAQLQTSSEYLTVPSQSVLVTFSKPNNNTISFTAVFATSCFCYDTRNVGWYIPSTTPSLRVNVDTTTGEDSTEESGGSGSAPSVGSSNTRTSYRKNMKRKKR